MKKQIIISIFLFGSFCGYGQTVLSLRECVETAILNNLNVEQADIRAKSSNIQYQQSRLNKLPNLNGSIGHGINQGRSIDPFSNSYVNSQLGYGNYGVSAGVTLFSGGSLNNAVTRDKLGLQASQMDLQQAKDNLTFDVILAYLNVLTNEDVLLQTVNQTELSKLQVERLVKLNNDGSIPPSELSDLQGQYAGEQIAIINAKNNLESSKLVLCRLMNVSYSTNIQLEKIESKYLGHSYSSNQVFEQALVNFAAIKAAEFKLKSAEKAVDVSKGQLWPTLRFGVNVNTNYSSAAAVSNLLNTATVASSDYVSVGGSQFPVYKLTNTYSTDNIPYTRQLTGNFFSSLGLTLNIPIFNGLEQRNRIKQAQLEVKGNNAVLKTAKTELEQAIDQAYINYQSSLERFQTLEQQVAAFESSFQAASVRFDAGVGNSIDYLIAKNNLDRAKISFIVAQYDALLRSRILDFYKGELKL